MNSKAIYILALVFPFFSLSCTTECAVCADAINHMYEKIDQNDCDPERMADAVARIAEDCGDGKADFYAYLMAETCCHGDKKAPTCKKPMDEQIFDIPIELIVDEDVPKNYKIEIDGEFSQDYEGDFQSSNFKVVFVEVAQNTKVVVRIKDAENQLISEWESNLDFIRKSNYCLNRRLKISTGSQPAVQILPSYWN